MLTDPVALKDHSDTTHNYRTIANGTANGTVTRIDDSTNLASPGLLVIKHNKTGKGVDAVDRHLIQVSDVISDASGSSQITVNVSLAVPEHSRVSKSMVYSTIRKALGFYATGDPTVDTTVVDQILRGEG